MTDVFISSAKSERNTKSATMAILEMMLNEQKHKVCCVSAFGEISAVGAAAIGEYIPRTSFTFNTYPYRKPSETKTGERVPIGRVI